MEAEKEFERIKSKYKSLIETGKYDSELLKDINFLINIVDTMNKRAKMNKYNELKSDIEKHILDELEVLTRNCYKTDLDGIKILSESYKNIKE